MVGLHGEKFLFPTRVVLQESKVNMTCDSLYVLLVLTIGDMPVHSVVRMVQLCWLGNTERQKN